MSEKMGTESSLKWGILGTGMIAGKFATDLPGAERGTLVATASRGQESADAFAAKHGGRGVAGYQALLDDPEVEAVYISLPNGLHNEWAIKALRAGKHVLCEKPGARNTREAEEMFAVAEETGQVLIEAFMYRAMPVVKKVIEVVRSGEIGDLRLIRSNFTFCREASMEDARYHPDQAGGSLMDVGCYCLNFCRALTGMEPTELQAIARLHPAGVDEYAAGTLRFGEDILATFTCGMTVVSDDKTFIAGTKGRIEISSFWFGQQGFRLTREDGQTEVIEAPATKPLYAMEADAFAETVLDGVAPWITKEDTLGNMAALDALRLSAGVPVPGI